MVLNKLIVDMVSFFLLFFFLKPILLSRKKCLWRFHTALKMLQANIMHSSLDFNRLLLSYSSCGYSWKYSDLHIIPQLTSTKKERKDKGNINMFKEKYLKDPCYSTKSSPKEHPLPNWQLFWVSQLPDFCHNPNYTYQNTRHSTENSSKSLNCLTGIFPATSGLHRGHLIDVPSS